MYAYSLKTDREIASYGAGLELESLYTSGADGLVSTTTPDGVSYASFNPHGDLSALTDESGSTTAEIHYDAWGNMSEATEEPFNLEEETWRIRKAWAKRDTGWEHT